jgi:transcription antitermination factor NusG
MSGWDSKGGSLSSSIETTATGTRLDSVLTASGLQPWYGIRTRSNQEKIAAAVLTDKGYEPFVPVYQVRRRWSDRVVTTERPLFSGYVFCRFDYNHRSPIVTTNSVVSVVGFGGQPTPIPDEEINAVRAIVESGIAAEPAPFLREGQRIRVTHGPLKSVEGALVRKKSVWSLVVAIEILQRCISVEIDPAHVQAV